MSSHLGTRIFFCHNCLQCTTLQRRKIRRAKCRPFAGPVEFPPFKKLLDPRKFRCYTAW